MSLGDTTRALPESFLDWVRRHKLAEVPWLVVGKGPTFSRLDSFQSHGMRVLALNHVARDLNADIGHAIDLDVLTSLEPHQIDKAGHWLVPWHPHVNHRASRKSLVELCDEIPVLASLNAQGRLLWYHASSSGRTYRDSPVVPVRYFSAEAAIGALALAGVRKIRTIGVDGGASYASQFADLSNSTLLANGRSSFNRQFETIAAAVYEHHLDFGPLDAQVPVRVYVATMPEQLLATRVLEHSIRRLSSISVSVHPLCETQIEIPQPAALRNRPRTPFSFQRFLIPEATGFQGRAIYLDSDMQVFRDIRELWLQSMGDAPLLSVAPQAGTARRPQFSVMLLDCQQLDWQIASIVAALDSGELNYDALMYEMKVAPGWQAGIDPCWNSLERYDDSTALLHYTDMHTQPWISTRNPLGYLWVAELRLALANGHITADFLRDSIHRGHVRPSLAWQVEHGVDDPLLMPRQARRLDKEFRPLFEGLETANLGSPWIGFAATTAAHLRHAYRLTGVPQMARRVRDWVYR